MSSFLLRSSRALAFALVAFAAAPLQAQNQTLTIVVPFPAGGGVDAAARSMADKLSKRLGEVAVVENRAGVAGNIAANHVAKARADGRTLLLTSQTPITIADALDPKLQFSPTEDLTPVGITQWTPIVLVTPTELNVRSLQDFVKFANDNKDKVFFGSAGTGHELHLMVELAKKELGIDMTHVPYKGTSPGIIDLVANRIQLMAVTPSSVTGLIQSGKLTPLALLSKERSDLLPDVPTAAEAGYPRLTMDSWVGLFAPAGTPAERINQLHAELKVLETDADYITILREQGMRPAAVSPSETAALVKNYRATWADLIREYGITSETQ